MNQKSCVRNQWGAPKSSKDHPVKAKTDVAVLALYSSVVKVALLAALSTGDVLKTHGVEYFEELAVSKCTC